MSEVFLAEGRDEFGGGVVEGEAYTGLDTGLVVEVLAGAGRHGILTVTRIR